jgi:hypothetical protein
VVVVAKTTRAALDSRGLQATVRLPLFGRVRVNDYDYLRQVPFRHLDYVSACAGPEHSTSAAQAQLRSSSRVLSLSLIMSGWLWSGSNADEPIGEKGVRVTLS